jgi:aspartate/glutamate racemase
MTNLSSITVRLDTTSFHLREFSDAIRFFRKKGLQSDKGKVEDYSDKLLKVLLPLKDNFKEELSKSISIDEYSVTEILKQKHDRDWQQFKNQVSEITVRVSEGKTDFSVLETDVLYEIADAVDMECAQLFKKISGQS